MKPETVIEFRKPVSVVQMSCTACGAEGNASCDCGAPYLPISDRVKRATETNPEKSNRAIAADLGISHPTVAKYREPSGNDLPEEINNTEQQDTKEIIDDVSGLDLTTKEAVSNLASEYRKHTLAHTTHMSLARKDIHRAGRALLEMKKFIEVAGMDWWSFYSEHFDKSRKYAEQAMRAVELDAKGEH